MGLDFDILRQTLQRLARKQLPQYEADVVQETLQILIQNINSHKYPPDASQGEATAYAIGILRHIIIRTINGRRAERPLEDPSHLRLSLAEEENPESLLLSQESDEQRQVLASRALKSYQCLPADCKQLIKLHVLDGLSYAKISRHLGRPKQTLVSQFKRCMEKLRERLRPASYES